MRAMPTTIRAVISDVDGTLVTGDKTLSGRARAAVAELRARGIGFTIMSSRQPRRLGMLLAPLRLTTFFAACNGGIIAAPDLSVIAEHDVPAALHGAPLPRWNATTSRAGFLPEWTGW